MIYMEKKEKYWSATAMNGQFLAPVCTIGEDDTDMALKAQNLRMECLWREQHLTRISLD